jgi:UDP-N-acetylglucosamine--N-acetylmuramyl-(pentapeptide) pyrophosphoryl-undecaprenol N-acetylglucosamine transferase
MKVIISGGGTGGHIYPGIALADEIIRQDSTNQVLFVGAAGKMEMSLVPAAGYEIIGLPIKSIARKQLYKNLSLPFSILKSLWQARQILKKFKPDVVIGTGGYASFPTVYMAARMRIPVLLQEQNAYPGIANKLLAKYAHQICVAYENMAAYFSATKTIVTGNPVRAFLQQPKEDYQAAYEYFGLTPGVPTVLVLGGSLGARALVDCTLRASQVFGDHRIQVLLSTGKAHFEQISKDGAYLSTPYLKILPYIDRLDLAFAAATIIVSRAGAIAMAEIGVAQKPAIFVPSPNVVADHQMKNVLPWLAQDAAVLVKEAEIDQKLIPAMVELVQDPQRQRTLVENLRKQARPDAAGAIVALISQLASLTHKL